MSIKVLALFEAAEKGVTLKCDHAGFVVASVPPNKEIVITVGGNPVSMDTVRETSWARMHDVLSRLTVKEIQ